MRGVYRWLLLLGGRTPWIIRSRRAFFGKLDYQEARLAICPVGCQG